jgi:hydrogenase maturation protease
VSEPPRRLVLCLGNPDRGDDGVGRLVARLLSGRCPDDVLVAECDGGAAEVFDRIAGRDCAILIDAAVSGVPAGTVHRMDCVAGEVAPTAGVASSHGLGVAEAIALARTLGCLPRSCVIYAVEAKRLAPGDELSPEVIDAARQVADSVLLSVRGARNRGPTSAAVQRRFTLDAGNQTDPKPQAELSRRSGET